MLERLGVSWDLARFALLLFTATRLAFVAITLLATRFLRPIGPRATSFVDAWARFDATYYARLARDGYQPTVLWRTAFFPLQPLATRIVLPLAGGNIYLAGIVVANLSYFAALLGLAALVSHEHDAAVARRAMLYLSLFPTAFFLFAGYAESLFLALAIWCFVALRRGGWWQAAVLGMLAALTRQMGCFLVLPFAYEYLARIHWRPRALRVDALWVLLIPTGILLFMGWLAITVGDPLAFVHAEHYWQHTFEPPWLTLWWALRALPHAPDTIILLKSLVDLGAVVLFAGLIVLGIRRMRPGDTLFCAAVWLLAVCYPTLGWTLQSDARYMLAAFPCFVLLAREGRRPWLNVLILGFSGLALLVMTQYFVRGAVIL
ncbi:MAG TPA: mannosyltransferase family protein [Ktedonobacterales bacterium]|jgi:hypothetical protein|nr:mannosyltransferase family protein [Ktedonobacterales bacterium]